ncbi:MAG TPA: YraN family protein [Candidatus Paceibacterota bacterium]|nr:YraN family protein [Candidatus Paceibacterota bacterium]HRZ34257.1 YraN family protein [Candidatus Paceibacterota bacterium]
MFHEKRFTWNISTLILGKAYILFIFLCHILEIPSKIRIKGNFGEDIAVRFLVKQGFRILARNYLRRAGEIDIIAERFGEIHFIEVKSIFLKNVSRETIRGGGLNYRPEENVSRKKIFKMIKAAELFLLDRGPGAAEKVHFDVIAEVFDCQGKILGFRYIKDVNCG